MTAGDARNLRLEAQPSPAGRTGLAAAVARDARPGPRWRWRSPAPSCSSLGSNPLDLLRQCAAPRALLRRRGLQETLTRMAPLLLLAAGLIVAFRAGIWNLGGDGQFLLAAVITAAAAPALVAIMPPGRRRPCHLLARRSWSAAASGRWCRRCCSAYRRQRDHHHADDDASSALASPMCWSSSSSCDPATTVPQTRDAAGRRPAAAALRHARSAAACSSAWSWSSLVHLMMTRTAFGLKLQVVGANPARRDPCRARCRPAHHRRLRA